MATIEYISCCSVHRMLDSLGWPSLEQRRKTSRLGVVYKIYNGLVQCPIIKTKLAPPLPPPPNPLASAAPTVNSLASSPPEHSTEMVPFLFYPTPSGTGTSLQGCSRGDDCRHFCVMCLPLTSQLIFCFVLFLRTFCFVLCCEHPQKCRNNHQHDCGHLRKEEDIIINRGANLIMVRD